MRYEEYKGTEHSWQPSIPKHWNYWRARRLFDNPKEKNANNEEKNILSLTLKGVIRNDKDNPIGLAPSDYATYQLFDAGELVFKLIDLENVSTSRVGIVPERGIMSSAYIRFKPRNELNIRYFYYQYNDWYQRQVFNGLGAGVRQTLSAQDLLSLKIIVPPREEQDQIVRYLDWKVSCINKLIHGYQRQIKLLEERKNTILDNAVFHGIDNRTLSFSGNKLLGNIPEHWNIIKLRSLLTPISVKNHPNEQLLSVVREQGIIVRDIESKESNHNYIPDDLSGYKLVEKGNFVINKMKAWQGSYGVSNYRGIVSPAYYVFDLKHECPEFFHIAIRCKRYVQFFNQASDGIRVGQWDLSMNRMKEIPFVMPPVEEQMKIVEYIKAKFAEIDSVKPMLEKEIELLREYRTRLISDVVTGQMDVRNIEIPEFEAEFDFEADTGNETDEGDDTMNEEATTDE